MDARTHEQDVEWPDNNGLVARQFSRPPFPPSSTFTTTDVSSGTSVTESAATASTTIFTGTLDKSNTALATGTVDYFASSTVSLNGDSGPLTETGSDLTLSIAGPTLPSDGDGSTMSTAFTAAPSASEYSEPTTFLTIITATSTNEFSEPTNILTTQTLSSATVAPQSTSSPKGLSDTGKVGIGVGVGVGLVLFVAALAFYCVARRRNKSQRQIRVKYEPPAQPESSGVEAPFTIPVPMSAAQHVPEEGFEHSPPREHSEQYREVPRPMEPEEQFDNRESHALESLQQDVFQAPISSSVGSPVTPLDYVEPQRRGYNEGPPVLNIPGSRVLGDAGSMHSSDLSPVSPISPLSAASSMYFRAPPRNA